MQLARQGVLIMVAFPYGFGLARRTALMAGFHGYGRIESAGDTEFSVPVFMPIGCR
jgi:hypothetical protein